MDAGVRVSDSCIDEFKTFNSQKSQWRALVFAINDECSSVDVVKKIAKGENADTWNDLIENVIKKEYETSPVWVTLNFETVKVEDSVERHISKLVYLHWCPNKSKLKLKMLMASTKGTLYSKLNCSMVCMEGTALADLEEKYLLEKLKSSL
ncbi:hypothetical protein ABK040_008829 [Willaertia magna]